VVGRELGRGFDGSLRPVRTDDFHARPASYVVKGGAMPAQDFALIDHGPAAREVIRLLDGVTDGALTGPTPCDGMPVGALLEHFMGLSLAFTWAARKTPPPDGGGNGPGTPKVEDLDPRWRTELPQRLEALAQAWRDPAAYEGLTEAGGVTMPGAVMATVALDELVLHGWDLAVATGQEFGCDPASLQVVLGFTSMMAGPEHLESREGLFGPVVEVPADAPDLHRALGNAGRHPAWTPAHVQGQPT
jgi:uncharacterized protein (TIGR03086 family)